MSERRYVVEIARAVSDDRIETASDYVAARLGMDRQRIRTLLSGRTGPVTRPVLAEKADSIAEVFTDAGVTVMIVEALEDEGAEHEAQPEGEHVPETSLGHEPGSDPAVELGHGSELGHGAELDPEAELGHGADLRHEADQGSGTDLAQLSLGDLETTDFEEPDLDEPGFARAAFGDHEYEEQGFGPAEDPTHDWNIDAAWESDEDEAPWHESAEGPRDLEPQPVERPSAEPPYSQPAAGDTSSGAETNRPPQAGGPGEVDPDDPKLPSTRWVPSPFDDPTDDLSSVDVRREDVKVTWLPTSGREDDDIDLGGIDDLDAGREPSRPWVTPGPSQFGDLATPREGAPLRSFLLWALVVSVLLLIGLQLLFAVRERGTGVATYESGLQAYRDGDFVSARRQWEDVAQSGDPAAQYMLGHLVQNGLGQPWSNAAAASWYRLAADQGLPEAQTALADLYLRGVGVEPSLESGALLLQRAAASGYPPAVYQYAELLLHGRGVQRDFDAALALFATAAESGSSEAADFVALAEHVRAGALGSAAP